MAQQIINVGSAPNDGTGDVLRNSQIKANANFTELYNDVDLKLDKVTSSGVERAYGVDASGNQIMIDTSGFGGGLRTFICEFGINQTVAATPTGNTQWFCRTIQAGHNISASWTLNTSLDVSTSFATHHILTPSYSLPFQAKIKSVYVRGWHSSFNSTGVDFVVLKSKETGPTISGAIMTVSNPLIVARENVQIWIPGAGNGFLKQFDSSSLTTTTLPSGSDIRLVFKNQNTNSAMWDTLVTIEFEEVI